MKKALECTVADERFTLPSPIAESTLSAAKSLLSWINEAQNCQKTCETEEKILDALKTAFCSTAKTLQPMREKMWGHYHTVRTSDSFIQLWVEFLTEVKISPLPSLYQHLTDIIFKDLVKLHFRIYEEASTSETESQQDIAYEDANAIRYVAGYVCRKVKSSLKQKSQSPRTEELLWAMWDLVEDVEPEDDKEKEFSVEWIRTIDRGGLLRVNNDTYLSFAAMESVIQRYLTIDRANKLPRGFQHELLQKVLTNDSVQFHWSFVSADMSEEIAKDLLERLANSWITVRGFSFSKCYVELYKQEQKKFTGRSKGLRKELFTSKLE